MKCFKFCIIFFTFLSGVIALGVSESDEESGQEKGEDQKQADVSFFLKFPVEIQKYIFSQEILSYGERRRLAEVCKAFSALISDEVSWPKDSVGFCRDKYGKDPWGINAIPILLKVEASKLPLLMPYSDMVWGLQLEHRRKNPITDEVVGSLRHFPKLDFLDLNRCKQVTDLGLEAFKEMPLTHLYLAGCDKVTDKGVKHMPMTLVSLDLSFTNITGTALQYLPEGLTTLLLIKCKGIADEDFRQIPRLKALESLNLGSCSKITDDTLKYIVERCSNTSTLDLLGCRQITDASLQHFQKNLTDLNLGCTGITNNSFQYLVDRCPNLTRLSLENCIEITDLSLIQGLSKLAQLGLYGCKKIADNSLLYLPENLTKLNLSSSDVTDMKLMCMRPLLGLTELDLGYCSKVTDRGLAEIVRHCPNLQKLSLSQCRSIGLFGLAYLCNLPNLTSLILPGPLGRWYSEIEGEELKECLKDLAKKWLVIFLYDQGVASKDLPDLPSKTFLVNPNALLILPFYECQINGCEVTRLDLGERLEEHREMLEELREYRDQELKERLDPPLRAFLSGQDINLEDLSSRTLMVGPSELSLLFHRQSEVVGLSLREGEKDPVTGDTIKLLNSFPNIRTLCLVGCTNIVNDDLKDLPQGLTELDLSRCAITDDALRHIRRLENLHTLKLNHCNIRGPGLEYLQDLGITSLDLSMCSDIDFRYLEEFEALSCLSLSGTNVTDMSLRYLPKGLGTLHFYACNNITDEGLQYLPNALTMLEFYHCKGITGAGVEHLGNLSELTELYLCFCSEILGDMSECLKKLPKLRILLLPNGERYEERRLELYLEQSFQ